MKTILYLPFLFCAVLFGGQSSFGQIVAGKAGKFGADGDLFSDQALSGINANQQAGSHDWFKKPGGPGIGLFDTTGAYAIKQRIMKGENLSFTRQMQYPRYTVQGGDILMDASYTRDEMGIIGTDLVDKTMFYSGGGNTVGAKLGDDPTIWKTVPTGGQISSKTDIVDTYVNLRRDGNSMTSSNIMLHVGATTLGSDGDRYVSFLISKERMMYNPANGSFVNSGPSTTGGHSAWTFSNNAITATGDLALCFNFGSNGVDAVQFLVWCNYNDYKFTNPDQFDFVNNVWYGSSSKSGWGWAGIGPNAGAALRVWGATNTAIVNAPVWGTSSKSLGDIANNYAAQQYEAFQFAEASIDLSSIGLDFVFSSGNNCNPPFTRYMVATRSASGNSASMMDFIGPYEFMDAPVASADINDPGPFNCVNSTALTLSPAGYISGAKYSWVTDGGNFTHFSSDSATVKINKPGTYILTASIMEGCTAKKDTLVVGEDYYRPKAKATNSGLPISGGVATLFGGDAEASNFMTPFGGSKGLAYKWNGPGGFQTSTYETASTTKIGQYQLIVTEARNGCKDTAYTTVSVQSDSSDSRYVTLAVKFTDFSVNTDKARKQNNLSWSIADVSEVEKFVVERSADNKAFVPAGYVFTNNATRSYAISDAVDAKGSYYRIRAMTRTGMAVYTNIIRIKGSDAADRFQAYADGSGSVVVNYTASVRQTATFTILNMSGQVMKKLDRSVSAGSNMFRIGDFDKIPSGVYLLQVISGYERAVQKITKM
jgi:hypothetical protein